MHPGLTTRTAALLAAALAVASALGYWGVSTYRKSELQKAVTALVKDTSERLQAALAIETGTMPADHTGGRLDAPAQEVAKHGPDLRPLSTPPDPTPAAPPQAHHPPPRPTLPTPPPLI